MEMSGQFHAPIFCILEKFFCLRADCKLSVYHVNQQTKLDMACCFFTDSTLVQGQCLLDSKSSTIFHLLHIHPFFTHTTAFIVNLKVHQGFVLNTSCVPGRVGINQKGKK